MNVLLSTLAFLATLCLSLSIPVEEELISIEAEEALSLTAAEELVEDEDAFLSEDRNAIRDRKMRWPGGVVYYVISNEYSAEIKSTMAKAMREIERDVNGKNTCIQFKPRTTQANYVNIHVGDGCHSNVGFKNKGKQEVSIGKGCEIKGIIMHELLHSLGFMHEQNRPDRDTYITIVESNVPKEEKQNFVKFSSTVVDTLGVPYSFDSIMQYGAYSLAADKSKPVMMPKAGKFHVHTRMGQRLGLVPSDVKKIQLLYGCPVDTSHIISFKTNNVAACNFETSMCNLKATAGNFNWVRAKGASGAGPNAGNTNGADYYLVAKAAGHTGKVARFVTPMSSQGAVCLDFFLFQKGPTSYIDLLASGPHIKSQKIATMQTKNKNQWYNHRLNINVPSGIEFQVTIEAHMGSGDIGIDDFNMYKGKCI